MDPVKGPATDKLTSSSAILNEMSPSEVLGEIAKLMMIDKTHKFMHLADLEWLVIPPVMLRQCRLFRAKDPKSGKTRIVGAVFWAFVTPDISQRF